MNKIIFTKGNWENSLDYAYTTRMAYTPKLIQEETCVRNGTSEKSFDGYDYTTLITKEMYSKDTEISLECSFESYGAPLFTFADKIWKDNEGNIRYSDCFEIVLWENGINVWKLTDVKGEVKPLKLFSAAFPVTVKEKHCISAKIIEKGFEIYFEDRKYHLWIGDLPDEVYIGVTACESINRLYSFTIDNK